MTEARRNEDMLRSLTHRVVQVQETERGRVANELRVNITQLLYVILGRCEALADKLPASGSSAGGDTTRNQRDGQPDCQRSGAHLAQSVVPELDKLGLVPALEKANAEFAARTGVSIPDGLPGS